MNKNILTGIIFSSFTFLVSAQNLTNQDVENFTGTPGSTGTDPQWLPNESFRFRPGIVTQSQSGTAFDFTSSEWFALGKVTSGQTFYGLRFQQPNRGLTFGYTSASANNPRIEWIHNGTTTAGNLEFRVGNGFGSLTGGGPGSNTLVASMTPFGNTIFGDFTSGSNFFGNSATSPKVGIVSNNQVSGLSVLSSSSGNSIVSGAQIDLTHASLGVGMRIGCQGGANSFGVFANAAGQSRSIAIYGEILPLNQNTLFGAAIYGDAQIASFGQGSNRYAGYFNGDIATTAGFYQPSDAKLKQNIVNEKSALEQIALLRPVTYTYNKTEGIALPEINQHGFISQELAEVFPELTKDILHPIFDKEGKVVSELSYKAINYIGLISVLTAGIQELNTELQTVRAELNDYKANDNVRSQLMQNSNATNGYSMEQNIPNPFDDRSIIRYQLAPGVERATISIFNLNGGLVRDYVLSGNKGEITILASDIGKGMFIYSLNLNGQEILSKRMIVK